MGISYTSDNVTVAHAVSATITSGTLTISTDDIVVAMYVNEAAGDNTLSIANSGTALAWTQIIASTDANNCQIGAWWAKSAGNENRTVTVTNSGTNASSKAKMLSCRVHTGAHATTPVPVGNVFSGVGATDVSQAITPTATGSALWMTAGDFSQTNSFAAIASCTLDFTKDEPGAYTGTIIRPSTQPRTDALAFTIGETDTVGQITWVAFEVAAALAAITVQPTDQLAAVGATAAFSITATNATTYQWQDDRTGDFTNVSGGSGATTSSYTTATTDLGFSNRRYRCVVDGAVFSNTANLYLGHPFAWVRA